MTPTHAPTVPTAGGCPMVINGELRIPGGITDLDSFRRWLHSPDFPEKGRHSYLGGLIWVEVDERAPMETLSHNDVRHEVAGVLRGLARSGETGRYFGGGLRLSNRAANWSTDPDGLFYHFTTQRSGRIQPVAGQRGGVVELVGTPDMVLDVVSVISVEKDTVILPPLYQSAGVPEFWRIDARQELLFEIFRLTPTGYVPTQHPDGWWRSDTFARDFRMTQAADPLGQPLYNLETR
jgi:Uma2 family endonuclease